LNWVIDQGECPDPPPVDEFDQAPEEFEEDVIKKEITSFPSTKPVQTKKKDVSRHPAPPPSEFNMEDNAIKRNTLQEIQSFFGITEPSDSSLNPNGTFEHKYSPTLMNSRSDSNSQSEAPPKDANEAVCKLSRLNLDHLPQSLVGLHLAVWRKQFTPLDLD
jgi:hypothetical protein